jgi:Ni/Fe-hydrogenase subunit HybB-like protein
MKNRRKTDRQAMAKRKKTKYIRVIEILLALILVDGRGTITSKERTFVNFMDTIYKFLHRIMFTITLQVSKLTKAVVLNSIPHLL